MFQAEQAAKEEQMATLSRGVGRASAWAVGTREVVYMAIGAALYGVIFGPWVGFFTGLVGNIIIDLLSGYGFSWNWSLANGLLGLIAGLAFVRVRGDEIPNLRAVITWSVIGTLL